MFTSESLRNPGFRRSLARLVNSIHLRSISLSASRCRLASDLCWHCGECRILVSRRIVRGTNDHALVVDVASADQVKRAYGNKIVEILDGCIAVLPYHRANERSGGSRKPNDLTRVVD